MSEQKHKETQGGHPKFEIQKRQKGNRNAKYENGMEKNFFLSKCKKYQIYRKRNLFNCYFSVVMSSLKKPIGFALFISHINIQCF